MKRTFWTNGAACLAIFGATIAWAQSDADKESLRAKQQVQQRARDMARELITGIFDVQLQQLRENGLQDRPIFGEIQAMRNNIDRLVEKEMKTVVNKLVEAQTSPPAEQAKHVGEARAMIRDVVVRLSVERQNLLRRLKAAELTAQVTRLIELQTAVQKTTV